MSKAKELLEGMEEMESGLRITEEALSNPKVRKAHGDLVVLIKDSIKNGKKVRTVLDAVSNLMNTIDDNMKSLLQ